MIVELPSISSPRTVPELLKKKVVSIKIYLLTNLLVGSHCFLLLLGFHDFPLVCRKFGLTLYCDLSYYLISKFLLIPHQSSTFVVPSVSSRFMPKIKKFALVEGLRCVPAKYMGFSPESLNLLGDEKFYSFFFFFYYLKATAKRYCPVI